MKGANLTNRKFTRLSVVEYSHSTKGQRIWRCVCECGNEVFTSSNTLLQGNTQSCGCLQKQKASEYGRIQLTKHGLSKENGVKTRLFRIWTGIKTRCYNKNDKAYPRYGGRGIVVCNEWLDFQKFHQWAFANGYNDYLSIDRVDVNGNYEPSNCRWTTAKEQANNRTNTKVFVVDGAQLTIKDVATRLGVSIQSIHARIQRGQIDKIINLIKTIK